MLGDCDVAVAGGAESMSRAAYFLPTGRWGQRMGDAAMVDAMVGALHDPFGHGHMGVTAENIAAKYGFTREQQDEFAVESHRRAARAIGAGPTSRARSCRSSSRAKKGVEQFTTDEHVRKDAEAGGHGQAEGRVQEGRHGHGRQRFRTSTMRRAAVVLMESTSGRTAKHEADGAPGGLRARGRRAAGHGPRADPGGEGACSRRPASSPPTWT